MGNQRRYEIVGAFDGLNCTGEQKEGKRAWQGRVRSDWSLLSECAKRETLHKE